MKKNLRTVSIISFNYLHIARKCEKHLVGVADHLLRTKSPLFTIVLFLIFSFFGKNAAGQIVGQYTGIDFATNYTNPAQGNPCGNISLINAAIGDADFVNGAAEIPLGWQFSGTWNSGLTYYDGPGTEVLLVSLHTYTERWHVALRLSNSTTTAFQDYNLTIATSNGVGNLTDCNGVYNGFNYERPCQELDFASYAIPMGVGVIGIIFEPFADGVADPDPHGVLVLEGTVSSNCNNIITTSQDICQGDSVLFQGTYYDVTGSYRDSLLNVSGCDSVLILNLTVHSSYLINQNRSICQGDSILLEGSFQTTAGVYTDSLQTIFGCDSVVITNLAVNPTYLTSQNKSICQGESILLGGSYQTTAGVYTDFLQTNFGCDSTVTTTLTVNQSADATITFNDTLCEDDFAVFITAASSGGVWSGNGITNSSNGQFDPSIAGIGQHKIVYSISGICPSSDSIYTIVMPPCNLLVIPNIFTPNGDGSNDLLVFKNLERNPNNHLVIYNRWGQNVFEADNYQNNWNGGGHSDGTYFFILKVDNLDTTYRGFITILK